MATCLTLEMPMACILCQGLGWDVQSQRCCNRVTQGFFCVDSLAFTQLEWGVGGTGCGMRDVSKTLLVIR